METQNNDLIRITSLVEWLLLVDKIYPVTVSKPLKRIFRGQSNCEHSLLPGIGRLLGKPRYPTKEALYDFEATSFQQFEISTYHLLKEQNPFAILAAAQHHGLSTRLLDWSFSPLVALFFAVENDSRHDKDGAVFVHYPKKTLVNILRVKGRPFDNNIGEYNYLLIPSITPRITAQSGLFQLFREPSTPLLIGEDLDKYIIPAANKSDIKAELFNAGITYSTLFPDLDGIAKDINYLLLNPNLEF